MSDKIDMDEIAKLCIGMSGADLSNILNEAAILAVRNNKQEISSTEIIGAINKVQIGLEMKGKLFSEYRQKLVSYHEAGHALLGL